ncbi:MAG: universal stress protein [Bacteroidia bacterium]
MQTIIVPTDFSESADNALAYACELARALKSKIVLFHTYELPVLATDYPVLPVTAQEMKVEIRNALNKTKEKFKAVFPELDFAVETVIGSVDREINHAISKHNVHYVVMGTRGVSGVGEILVGTNAASVMEHADCPVIVVPANAKFEGLKKIVLAADYGEHNYEHAENAIDFAKVFNAEVALLHVSKGDSDDTFEESELMVFKNRLVERQKYNSIITVLVNDFDAFHGINTFIEEYKAELLIVSMRSRTLLQKVFSRSLTKRMAYHSHIPVMALHISNKREK